MRSDTRRLRVIAAALASLAVATGCTGNTDTLTLAEASKQLITDGDKLVASQALASTGSATVTERAGEDSEAGCLKGQVQRFFRAQGDLKAPPNVRSPGGAAALMSSWLRLHSYEKIVDDLDLRDASLGMAVLRHPTTGITFLITIRDEPKPNILIVGKTRCYGRDG
ncbi:hypothetical protein [Nonomuraea typhae]|uniref:Lipoprotein n=1 Tax=Nonomuraea typhae TaxID=2603600 RepID=A0ABW7YSW5_9ACTN